MIRLCFIVGIITSAAAASADQIGCPLPKDTTGLKPVNYEVKPFDPDAVASPQVRASWAPEKFSDPGKHDRNNFRYIVHMVDLMGQHFSAESSYQYISQEIANNPCATISVSVIDQNKNATFGSVGFILRVPAENVLLAKGMDFGTFNLGQNHDPRYFNYAVNLFAQSAGQLSAPEKILEQTNDKADLYKYNEVLVQGNVRDGIAIIGIIIDPSNADVMRLEATSFDKEEHDRLVTGMTEIAHKNNLPVVYK